MRAKRIIGIAAAALWLAPGVMAWADEADETPKRCILHAAPGAGAPLFVAYDGDEFVALPDPVQTPGLIRSVEPTDRGCLAQLFAVDDANRDVSISGLARPIELLSSQQGPYRAVSCTCF